MLCTLCRNIQFKRFRQLTREEKIDIILYCELWSADGEDEVLGDLSDDDLNGIEPFHQYFSFHHDNLEALQNAADEGCDICYHIFYGLLETRFPDHDLQNISDRLYLDLEPPDDYGPPHGYGPPEKQHLHSGELRLCLGADIIGWMRLKDLDTFAKFVPKSQNIEQNSSTGSIQSLDLIAHWLHDCANNHTHCCYQPQMKTILPYRVLDLGYQEKSQKLFLSVGEDRAGSYAALSYCWGKPGTAHDYVTTKDNLKQRQENVDQSTLPKTFTDAILVCRHLGIRFLWIDSLCIIQGDSGDWRTQSERMGDIYSNATLTIAAAVGEDTHSGLFIDRDPRKTNPCLLNFQYPKEAEVSDKGVFLACQDPDLSRDTHLYKRGWTFQEEYLSPRTLTFSNSELYWTCASSNASEGLPMGLYPGNSKSDFEKYVRMDTNMSCSTEVHISGRYHWWYQTIELYSYRVFTRESDRLLALAGLAARFKQPDDEFLSGLWKSDLVHGLAWRLGGKNEKCALDNRPSPISTWSWASRPGHIITYSDDDLAPMNWPEDVSIVSRFSVNSSEGNHQNTSIEVLSVEPMPPSTHMPSSSISHVLRLRGLVLRLSPRETSLAYDNSSLGPPKYLKFTWFRDSSPLANKTCRSFKGFAYYDELVVEDENLHCLLLKPGIWLLLKMVDAESMRFRRVGRLDISDKRLLDGLEPVTLEII